MLNLDAQISEKLIPLSQELFDSYYQLHSVLPKLMCRGPSDPGHTSISKILQT